jgi:ubiquitin C-terminal hydrolase
MQSYINPFRPVGTNFREFSNMAASEPFHTTIGLANVGNTCFLNVILQALRISPPMVQMVLQDLENPISLREESKKRELVTAFQILMQDFWKARIPAGRQPTMIPRGFVHAFYNVLRTTDDDWHRPGEQSDAAEVLQYILEGMHDGIHKKVRMEIVGDVVSNEDDQQIKAIQSWADFHSKEYSPIIHNFYGQSQITVECTNCGNKNRRYEPWMVIKAPIPGSATVGAPAPSMDDCIAAAFDTETIDDYACEKCSGKHKATITTRVSRMPAVLFVSLKRFTNMGHKVRGRIGWDLDSTRLHEHCAFRRDPFTNTPNDPEYETYAVIEHLGGLRGGHYRMYARQGDWYMYDDSSVHAVPPERVVTEDSYIACMIPKRHAAGMRAQMNDYISRARDFASHAEAEAAAAALAMSTAAAPSSETVDPSASTMTAPPASTMTAPPA